MFLTKTQSPMMDRLRFSTARGSRQEIKSFVDQDEAFQSLCEQTLFEVGYATKDSTYLGHGFNPWPSWPSLTQSTSSGRRLREENTKLRSQVMELQAGEPMSRLLKHLQKPSDSWFMDWFCFTPSRTNHQHNITYILWPTFYFIVHSSHATFARSHWPRASSLSLPGRAVNVSEKVGVSCFVPSKLLKFAACKLRRFLNLRISQAL